MTADLALLGDVTRRVFARLTEDGTAAVGPAGSAEGSDEPRRSAWSRIADLGLTTIGVAEEAGGAGGGLAELGLVLFESGYAGLDLPLEEHALATWMLHAAGQQIPAGVVTLHDHGDGDAPTSDLTGVAWARMADAVVVVGGAGTRGHCSVVAPDAASLENGVNLAGEPSDTLREAGVGLVGHAVPLSLVERLRYRRALCRAARIDGAVHRVLDLSLRHARDREQFGRPIGRFQAVQHGLAELASESRLLHALVAEAARTADGSDDTALVVAAAAARAGDVATCAARIGHQIHGAIGWTTEHPLGRFTTRLLAWRDEPWPQAHWELELGRRVREVGSEAFWRELVGSGTATS
jgi:acyl-CoA dehydrogenase